MPDSTKTRSYEALAQAVMALQPVNKGGSRSKKTAGKPLSTEDIVAALSTSPRPEQRQQVVSRLIDFLEDF